MNCIISQDAPRQNCLRTISLSQKELKNIPFNLSAYMQVYALPLTCSLVTPNDCMQVFRYTLEKWY